MTNPIPTNYIAPLDFARSWARVVRGEPPLPPTRVSWVDQLIRQLPRYSEDMEEGDHPYYNLLHGGYPNDIAQALARQHIADVVSALTVQYEAGVARINTLIPKTFVFGPGDILGPGFRGNVFDLRLQTVDLKDGLAPVLVPQQMFHLRSSHYKLRNQRNTEVLAENGLAAALRHPLFEELPLVLAGQTLLLRTSPRWRMKVPSSIATAVRNRDERVKLFQHITTTSLQLAAELSGPQVVDLCS